MSKHVQRFHEQQGDGHREHQRRLKNLPVVALTFTSKLKQFY
jgi:hypothetical protein